MFKIPFQILTFFTVIFTIYSILLWFKFKKGNEQKVPKFHAFLNRFFSEFEPTRVLLDYLKRSYFLIYQSKAKGEVLAVTLIALYPAIFIVTYSILNAYTNVWYLSLLNMVLCAGIPFYMIKNKAKEKCRNIRVRIIDCYSSLAVLLSQNKMEVALQEVCRVSTGPCKNIFLEFNKLYNVDKLEAYEYLVNMVSDNYTDSVVQNLIKFEEYGTDPSQEILRVCKYASSMYYLESLKFKSFNYCKKFSVGSFFFNIILFYMGRAMAVGAGSQSSFVFLYICLLICIVVYLLCCIFESN